MSCGLRLHIPLLVPHLCMHDTAFSACVPCCDAVVLEIGGIFLHLAQPFTNTPDILIAGRSCSAAARIRSIVTVYEANRGRQDQQHDGQGATACHANRYKFVFILLS